MSDPNILPRTCGDGMEMVPSPSGDPSTFSKPSSTLFDKMKSHTSSLFDQVNTGLLHDNNSLGGGQEETVFKPTVPNGKKFYLIPKLVTSNRVNKNLSKFREPKFVPFEPYKGAVKPILPTKKQRVKIPMNKNNLDLNILVTQMSEMAASELDGTHEHRPIQQAIQNLEMENMKGELETLKTERDYYKSQTNFQGQVNAELKKLLVAAVGEDLQAKVNVLTEDKLHLARALVDSAQNLSSHTEQIEYLVGQCEVWRSKFLASSLMVEELARWKASLTQKNNTLTAANSKMLETTAKAKEINTEVMKNLLYLCQQNDVKLQSANLLDISSECLNLSQQMTLNSDGIGMPNTNLNQLKNLEQLTEAEKMAVEALQTNNRPLQDTELAYRAVMDQAFHRTSREASVPPSE